MKHPGRAKSVRQARPHAIAGCALLRSMSLRRAGGLPARRRCRRAEYTTPRPAFANFWSAACTGCRLLNTSVMMLARCSHVRTSLPSPMSAVNAGEMINADRMAFGTRSRAACRFRFRPEIRRYARRACRAFAGRKSDRRLKGISVCVRVAKVCTSRPRITVPSSFISSASTPTVGSPGARPDRLHASVWPERISTPPSRAISGNT